MVKLERGKLYPFQLPKLNTVRVKFSRDTGNILIIHLQSLDNSDEWVLRNGILKAGMLNEESAIMLFFCFYDRQGKVYFTVDCPFDVRKIPKESLELPSMKTTKIRLAFEIHAIDGKGILRCLRKVTLPLSLSTRFLSLVMDQQTDNGLDRSNRKIEDYLAIDFDILYSHVKFDVCGK